MSKEDSGFRTLIGSSDEGAETTRSAAFAQIAFERIGLFAAAFGFAILLMKIMRVSHLNSRTGHALLTHGGPVEVILGAFVTHFPTILFIVTLLVVWWASGAFAKASTITSPHIGAALIVLFGLILLPWPFVVVIAAVGCLRFIYLRSRGRAGRPKIGYYLALGAAAILMITDSEPWIAPEVIALNDGSEVLGYVLDEAETSTGWLVVLVDEDRSVVRIREDTVTGRAPCHPVQSDRELEHYVSLYQAAIGETGDLPEPECPS